MNRSAVPALCGLGLGLGLALAAGAAAAELEVVELRAPVWLERAGQRAPLEPGQSLGRGDRLVAGREARILLQSGDGGVIKLGADSEFAVDELIPADGNEGVFAAAFRVLRGAFRFTTGQLSPSVLGRNLSFRVGTITAGVRGTDIWGRSGSPDDLVCLIEGEVEVRAGDQRLTLNRPLSFFSVGPDGVPRPLAQVEERQLGQWAADTEPVAGTGLLVPAGRWRLHLGATGSRDSAEPIRERAREAGYPAQLESAEVQGRQWWRVLVPAYQSAADAAAAGAALAPLLGVIDPWVSRR